jgi:hypothetical protein
MWTNQDEMFADEPEDSPELNIYTRDYETINEQAVTILDTLALGIVDGQTNVERIDEFNGPTGKTTLEVTYASY